MHKVLIQQVVSGPTTEASFTQSGRTVNPVSWMANVVVDGSQPLQNIRFRAFSPKVHWAMFPGNVICCDEPKTYKGQVEYKITTPSDANGHVNTQQGSVPVSQAPVQQHPVQQPIPYTPPQQFMPPPQPQQFAPPQAPAPVLNRPTQPQQNRRYTLDELEAVMKRGYDFAVELCGKGATSEDISRMASVYIIQVCKEGIVVPVKPPVVGGMNKPMQDVLVETIDKVLADAPNELSERCGSAEIKDAQLIAWWNECRGQEQVFITKVNYELTMAGF